MFDMHSLEAMLEDVLHGSEWQGVVQVPYSLQHLLGQQQDDNTVIDFTRTLAPAGGPPAQPAAASRVSGSGGWFQEDFQIGGAGRVPRKPVPTNLIAQQQPGGVLATVEEARGSGGESGLVTDARRPSLLDMAPGMQQRKFMSLLDKQAQGQSVAKRHAGDTPQQSISGAADDGVKVGGAAAGGVAVGAAGDEDDDEDDADLELEPECYHELHAIPLLDPVLDKQVGASRLCCCADGSLPLCPCALPSPPALCVAAVPGDHARADRRDAPRRAGEQAG